MDRNTAVVPKQQLGFYNFVARPMFEALDGLISMAVPLGHVSDVGWPRMGASDSIIRYHRFPMAAESSVPPRATLMTGRSFALATG